MSALIVGAMRGIGTAQTVTRVSTDGSGTRVTGASRRPSAGANGRFVAFSSTATTPVTGATNGSADVSSRIGRPAR